MPGMPSPLLIVAMIGLLGVGRLEAQVLQYELEGELPFAQLSDVDGDGVPEYFTRVIRGPDTFAQIRSVDLGQVLFEWSIPYFSFAFQPLGTPYDLNGDGYLDIVYGSGDISGNRTLEARSGFDGSQLWARTDLVAPIAAAGPSVALGDRNGDGITDFIQSLGNGDILHLSGLDGSTLQQNPSGFPLGSQGNYAAGDIDRDGIPDYFAKFFLTTTLFSGATDLGLFAMPFITPEGNSLTEVGDVNGDGFDDFAFFRVPFGRGRRPMEIWTNNPPIKLGTIPGHHCFERSEAYPIHHYDWDGDGTEDLVSWGMEGDCDSDVPSPPYFRIHSFSRGEDLLVLPTGHQPRAYDFVQAFFQEDFDGDGLPDPLFNSNISGGAVNVISLKPHLFANSSTLSQALGGTLTFDVDLSKRFAHKDIFLLIGAPGAYDENSIFSRGELLSKFGFDEFIALPFGRTRFTNALWRLRGSGNPKESDYTLTLDAAGAGTLTLHVAPGQIPVSRIGRGLSFAFLLPDLVLPQFPDGVTESVVVKVLP